MRRHAMSAISPTHKAYCSCGWTGGEDQHAAHVSRMARIAKDRILVVAIVLFSLFALYLIYFR